MRVLAIDPGQSGGAYMLGADGCSTVFAAGWKPCRRDKKEHIKLTVHEAAGRRYVEVLKNHHDVGSLLRAHAHGAPYLLVVEGLFGRGHVLERLSWSAALVAGPLLHDMVDVTEYAKKGIYRPRANQWRPRVYGKGAGRLSAKEADEYAKQWCRKINADLWSLQDNAHVCEAVAMAHDGFEWYRKTVHQ